MARPRDLVERWSDRFASFPVVRPRRTESLPITIDRRRVYILPTGFGLFLGAMRATMVRGGLNYNNTPALLLAVLIVAVANNSLLQAHLTLSGLRVTSMHAEPVHAGQPLELRIAVEATGNRRRDGLELRRGDEIAFFDLPPGGRGEVRLAIPTARRGWLEPGRMRLSTVRPLGLARAWTWLLPAGPLLVYPAPEDDTVPLPDLGGDGQASRARQQGDQPHQLRDYRPGDAPRQIAWKASARADRLLVREYEASTNREVELDWFALATLPHEARIRRLTRWVLEADRQAVRYRMRLPAMTIGPGRGSEHRHACLRALALLPDA